MTEVLGPRAESRRGRSAVESVLRDCSLDGTLPACIYLECDFVRWKHLLGGRFL